MKIVAVLFLMVGLSQSAFAGGGHSGLISVDKYNQAISDENPALVGYNNSPNPMTPRDHEKATLKQAVAYIDDVLCGRMKWDSRSNDQIADDVLRVSQQTSSNAISTLAMDIHSKITWVGWKAGSEKCE
jgi:hypothetical protein